MRGYPSLAVANEIIDRSIKAGRPMDPLQLQKLLYFAHGWHLAVTGKPLLNERVEAWDYGPVVPSVYHSFKHLGAGRIRELRKVYDPDSERVVTPRVPPEDKTCHELLDAVWEEYGQFSGPQLSDMSHQKGSPWDFTVAAARSGPYGFRRNQDIDDKLIHHYFLTLSKKSV